jgi:hypothetical protein
MKTIKNICDNARTQFEKEYPFKNDAQFKEFYLYKYGEALPIMSLRELYLFANNLGLYEKFEHNKHITEYEPMEFLRRHPHNYVYQSIENKNKYKEFLKYYEGKKSESFIALIPEFLNALSIKNNKSNIDRCVKLLSIARISELYYGKEIEIFLKENKELFNV